MKFISTRGNKESITASKAIIKGIAEDGGLYVPSKFPNFRDELKELCKLDYCQLTFYILRNFLSDFTDEELKYCINSAYRSTFSTEEITPITKIDKDYFLELYHGPTLAFKDIALSLMPYLLEVAINKNNLDKDILILTATSGDTGKAALEGFKNLDRIKISVFFPEDGVSDIQKLQMKTQEGKNIFVCGIKGNFDDAQSGVKNIFSNLAFNKYLNENGYLLSSANSINIGRLIPQIIYYFYSYFKLYNKNEINLFDKVNYVVPSGNFGNILAGYYAKEMGLPINKLICASNENKVLYDFFETGQYDINRDLVLTTSPSMDILISSNLERLLFESCNRDSKMINALYKSLYNNGFYKISNLMKDNLKSFCSYYASEDDVNKSIKHVFENYNYLIDTHTAVAYSALQEYKSSTQDKSKSIILSTASPYKFSTDVLNAIGYKVKDENCFESIDKLSIITKTAIPNPINDLKGKKIIHNSTYEKNDLELSIKNFLEI